MPEKAKPPILERQPWNFIFLFLAFALSVALLLGALYTNPDLNPEYPTQTIEVPE